MRSCCKSLFELINERSFLPYKKSNYGVIDVHSISNILSVSLYLGHFCCFYVTQSPDIINAAFHNENWNPESQITRYF